jgi:hypothetical protein
MEYEYIPYTNDFNGDRVVTFYDYKYELYKICSGELSHSKMNETIRNMIKTGSEYFYIAIKTGIRKALLNKASGEFVIKKFENLYMLPELVNVSKEVKKIVQQELKNAKK